MRNSWESNDAIIDRIIHESNYIRDKECTVRKAAKNFGIGKSTIHLDCTERLKRLNEIHAGKYDKLYIDIQRVIKQNTETKHIHGGEATKRKLAKLKELEAK